MSDPTEYDWDEFQKNEQGNFRTWDDYPTRKTRNVRFTLNNPCWEDIEALLDMDSRGIAFQEEIAPSTGTRHLQGFVRWEKALNRAQSINRFKDALTEISDAWPALFPADLPEKALIYCTSKTVKQKKVDEEGNEYFVEEEKRAPDGEVYIQGDLAFVQGKRTDISEFKTAIETTLKGTRRYLWKNHFEEMLKYRTAAAEAQFYLHYDEGMKEREREVYWLWGRTGLGKSRFAREIGAGDHYKLAIPTGNSCWFDGYDGQDTLIIEELNPLKIDIDKLKELTDRYELILPIKNAHTWGLYTKVVITSQRKLEDCYPFAHADDIEAMRRRIKLEKHYDKNTVLERDPADTRFFHLREEEVTTIVEQRHGTLDSQHTENQEADAPTAGTFPWMPRDTPSSSSDSVDTSAYSAAATARLRKRSEKRAEIPAVYPSKKKMVHPRLARVPNFERIRRLLHPQESPVQTLTRTCPARPCYEHGEDTYYAPFP